MSSRPYCLLMDGGLVDYFSTLDRALAVARQINVNRVKSSGGEKKKQSIKIIYDTPNETRTAHEE
jgi:hypothetical protein